MLPGDQGGKVYPLFIVKPVPGNEPLTKTTRWPAARITAVILRLSYTHHEMESTDPEALSLAGIPALPYTEENPCKENPMKKTTRRRFDGLLPSGPVRILLLLLLVLSLTTGGLWLRALARADNLEQALLMNGFGHRLALWRNTNLALTGLTENPPEDPAAAGRLLGAALWPEGSVVFDTTDAVLTGPEAGFLLHFDLLWRDLAGRIIRLAGNPETLNSPELNNCARALDDAYNHLTGSLTFFVTDGRQVTFQADPPVLEETLQSLMDINDRLAALEQIV